MLEDTAQKLFFRYAIGCIRDKDKNYADNLLKEYLSGKSISFEQLNKYVSDALTKIGVKNQDEFEKLSDSKINSYFDEGHTMKGFCKTKEGVIVRIEKPALLDIPLYFVKDENGKENPVLGLINANIGDKVLYHRLFSVDKK